MIPGLDWIQAGLCLLAGAFGSASVNLGLWAYRRHAGHFLFLPDVRWEIVPLPDGTFIRVTLTAYGHRIETHGRTGRMALTLAFKELAEQVWQKGFT